MTKEIVILSDLWGEKKASWLRHYESRLASNYKIKFYDACVLGGVALQPYEEEAIHQQFVAFGIDRAVSSLLRLEKQPKIYLACSVGGVIAWKAGLMGLPIERLIAISATRLRKETEKPKCPLRLYFGESDRYKPSPNWIQSMGENSSKIVEGGHDIYKNETAIEKILADIENEKFLDLM